MTKEINAKAYDLIVEDNNDYYGVYQLPERATAEVAYANLSKKLGLNCVEAKYTDKFGSPYTSISKLSPDWQAYEDWIAEKPIDQLENKEQVNYHHILNLLLLGMYMADELAGYITKEDKFVKANNGIWFSVAAESVVKEKKSPFERIKVKPERLQEIIEEFPEVSPFLKQIAQLTDEDLKECIDVPEWEHRERIFSFFYNIFKDMRQLAKDVAKNREGAI